VRRGVSLSHVEAAAYAFTAAALWLVLTLHLLPTLLAGLLVYSLVTALAPALQRRVPGVHAHWLVVALLAIAVVGVFILAIGATVAFLNSENGNPTVF
jgi:nucleoside recognition membrane protein YjiH